MIVTVEAMARPCPGVEQAVVLTEEALRRGEPLYTVGQLIHNRREVERLQGLDLHHIDSGNFDDLSGRENFKDSQFLVRTHGESEDVLKKAQECGLKIVDATCSIVRHSQNLVDQHVREGWGIIIAGDKVHAEVKALVGRTKGCGVVVSTLEEIEHQNFEDRSLLLAQTTIDPVFFSKIRRILSTRLSGLKIVDTTCRFLRNRQDDITAFSSKHDLIIFVGGNNSANCNLLHKAALEVNKRSFRTEGPEDVQKKWFRKGDRVGISGGASTPRWQLEEMRSYLSNHKYGKNPKGLKNRKGGKFLWWKLKNRNKTE